MQQPSDLSLLVVDDDDVAIEGVLRGLRRHNLSFPTTIAEDGLTALQILRGNHPDRTIAWPFVVLLDLNMPHMSGFEFLEELRADSKLRPTVVFVLTTSGADQDRCRAYQQNIAGYIVKSAAGEQFSNLARLICDYGKVVTLPQEA